MPVIHLGNAVACAALDTRGGVLTRFDVRVGGRWRAVLAPARGRLPTQSSAFPMVPWYNRLSRGGLAMPEGILPIAPNWPTTPYPVHGTGWLSTWGVLHRTPRHTTLRLRDRSSDPYDFACDLTAVLQGTRLSLSLSVRNTGPRALPFGLGWHPYFPRAMGTTLRLKASRRQDMDERGLPMPERAVSTPCDFRHPRPLPRQGLSVAYPAPDGFHLRQPDGLRVECWMSGARSCLLWSPVGSNVVCIEPTSHPVDAFGSGEGALAHVLAPDSVMALRFSLRTV